MVSRGSDDELIGDDGCYRRQLREYVRPPRAWNLPSGDLDHDVAATEIYGHILELLNVGAVVEAELVPEPLNAYDSNALCVDILGFKVGYVGRTFAEFWHPFVVEMNRAGSYVLAKGVVTSNPSDRNHGRGIELLLPEWNRWSSVHAEAGLDSGFPALWAQLSESTQAELMDGFGEYSPREAREVVALRHLMPSYRWGHEHQMEIPWPVLVFIRGEARKRDHREREMRLAARQSREETRAAERGLMRNRVAELRERGWTFARIGVELGLSPSKASALFREHNSA